MTHQLVESGPLAGGAIPVNTSGGLESEAIPSQRQGWSRSSNCPSNPLRRRLAAGADVRIAVAENAGGFVVDDTAAPS